MATESQIPKLAAQLLMHIKNLGALTTADAQWLSQQTPDALALFAEAINNRDQAQKFRLTFSRSMGVRTPISFSARGCFVEGKREGVKIASVSDRFKKHYLNHADTKTSDKREKDSHCRVFSGQNLITDAYEIVRREKFLFKPLLLPCVWALLKLASADAENSLQRNGYSTAILTKSPASAEHFVLLHWSPAKGWCVDASLVSSPQPVDGLIDYIVGS